MSPAELERRLEDLAGHGRPPLVVVIDEGVEKPLRIARTVHRRFPLSQILFLVPPELLPSFRSELLRAPMIGTNWSVLEANSGDLSGELAVAARSSRQRRQFRTNLDAINLRLASPTPAPDSSEYRKLVISDKYLATILEHAEEAIVSLDGRGRVASWNRGATGSFGYSLNEALELSVTDLVIETDRKLLTSWFEEAAGGRAVAQRETTCLRQDGSTFNAEVTMAPVRDEEGETIAVSLIARDVTARKETEEQLRNIQAELEKRVIERTEDLRYLNAELEAFTYSASHDLRAPLRGIDGFSQALLEDYRGKLDATGVKYLERIRSGAQRMGEIIDALLLLSRISTARLSRRRVDIGRLSKEILRELSESEPTRSVDVEIESGLVVRADPQLLRIALQNLLGNAWKFTREREKASIRVGRSDDETFYVSDNGAGFDMAYAEKLFTPFQRIHHPSRFEGSGIGLGTVQRVMNRHGGKVWGLGEPDAGATFYFRLPDYGAEEGTRTGAGGTADVSVEVDGPRGQE
ncbi:MAG TPA: PAS domain S-box protein [Trueperaceae bacterium]